MIKVKICGLSRPIDIEIVNSEKPEYVGFVFANSRRRVTPQQALELRSRLEPGIIPVGVFVDETVGNIVSLVQSGVVEVIQLHGSETEDYINEIKALTDKPVIKAVAVERKGEVQKWTKSSADYLLLDNKSGGTGRSFDWDLIGQTDKPYFLAGGLYPKNVRQAIGRTNPFAVDVSSGVEMDGFKDPVKIKEFIKRVREEENFKCIYEGR